MSDETQHSLEVEHGYDTFYKYPEQLDSDEKAINSLSNQLYPTGRAFNQSENGTFSKINEALNLSFVRVLKDSKSFINSLFPDNDEFTEEDASLWEYRLGLIDSSNTSLDLRKKSIRRKMGFPNGIQPRQNPNFIESQLRLAGFDVYVHENSKPYKTPSDLVTVSASNSQHGGDSQHGGGYSHGGGNFAVIANSLDEFETYSIGGESNLWATFFIGGKVLGESASVPLNRLKEFKETVIKLKPAHTVAFIFINFV